MIALSIRQPWAWLIVNGFKDIENRDWPTRYRGRFLVHAGKTLTKKDYDAAREFVRNTSLFGSLSLPGIEALERGGVVGEATLVDCVTEHPSPWFTGWANGNALGIVSYGFVLANARPLPFMPYKGRLKFFDVRGEKV